MAKGYNISKNQLYWLCQVLGWSSIILIETINYTFVLVGNFQWEYVTSFGYQAFLGLFVSHFYKVFFIKPNLFSQSFHHIWVRGLMDTLAISTIITVIILTPDFIREWQELKGQQIAVFIEVIGRILNQSRYIVVWVIIYYMYKILQQQRAMIQEKLQMESLIASTELELLKTQLNPHFLFNALNSIKALVLIDTEKARTAIVQLSELLRAALVYEKVPLIRMQEEIYKVEKYLELEKIRFGNRLHYTLDISAAAMEMQVPPALILTLAENAIKHGITQLPDGGEIAVSSKIEVDQLVIEVRNSGQLKEESGKGIGLKNIRNRLKSLFGEEAIFQLGSIPSNQVLVKVVYPIAN